MKRYFVLGMAFALLGALTSTCSADGLNLEVSGILFIGTFQSAELEFDDDCNVELEAEPMGLSLSGTYDVVEGVPFLAERVEANLVGPPEFEKFEAFVIARLVVFVFFPEAADSDFFGAFFRRGF